MTRWPRGAAVARVRASLWWPSKGTVGEVSLHHLEGRPQMLLRMDGDMERYAAWVELEPAWLTPLTPLAKQMLACAKG